MSQYVISGGSTADLTREHFEARDISYVRFHYYMDGKLYVDDLGESMPFEDFYAAMAAGAETRTSQVNVDEYLNYFEPFLAAGKDVLHLSLSSGLSGAYNSACIARDELKEKYPDRKLYVIDSLAASSGFGMLLDTLADLRDNGMDIDTLAAWAEEHRLELHHWLYSTDLTFYIKGGRISKAAGLFGTVLKICPLLNMDYEGHLIARQKVRGKERVMEELIKKMEKHAVGGTDYNGKCYISHSACREDAEAIAAIIEKKFPHLSGKVQIYSIGTTIGSHSGPGTLAVFFWGDERKD